MADRPVEAWRPPLTTEELQNVLCKMRGWEPFDADALLDDVGTALDDVPPTEGYREELAQRFRGHLMQLVDIAVGGEADVKDATALALIEYARSIRSKDLPGDPQRAVGHVRRMAWTVNELLERLLETGHLSNVNAA